MTTPHKASADQWHNLLQYLKLDRIPDHISITLELAARVEALEREAAMNELRAASAEARPAPFDEAENDRRFEQAKAIIDKPAPAPASSLVGRVAKIISHEGCIAYEAVYGSEARAAIREVGEWLERQRGADACYYGGLLREEADR